MAQEWLAEVRKGGDPSAGKNAARKAPTMKEFCDTFMEDYSKQRNKPSTQRGYQGVIDRCIIPIMGRMKVQDVKRPDAAARSCAAGGRLLYVLCGRSSRILSFANSAAGKSACTLPEAILQNMANRRPDKALRITILRFTSRV